LVSFDFEEHRYYKVPTGQLLARVFPKSLSWIDRSPQHDTNYLQTVLLQYSQRFLPLKNSTASLSSGLATPQLDGSY
jgi:hypothetical protein